MDYSDCNWKETNIQSKLFIGFVSNKSILKLTEEDYNLNGLSELLIEEGNYYDLNIKMFNRSKYNNRLRWKTKF